MIDQVLKIAEILIKFSFIFSENKFNLNKLK